MNIFSLNFDSYLITPLFFLLLIGGIIGVITFFFLIRFRKTPGVKYWLIWQVAVSIWAFTYAFEFAATDIETKIMWSKFSYFGIVYCTISFLFFSLEFTQQYRFLNKKVILAFYAIATLFLLSPFTNELHHLHWRSYSINLETNATNYVYGPLFWIIFIFSYLTLITGIINIIIFYYKSSGYYRRQIGLLFFASLLPPMGNLIYVFHLNPLPGFDWTPFSFLLTGILIALNISEYKMFDLVPFGRNMLIDIIPDAILIVDKSGRIADYNPAFRKLVDWNEKKLNGSLVSQVIPGKEDLIMEITNHDVYQTELSKEFDGETRHFDMHATALFDQTGQKNGRLIIIKDITRFVMAEEKIKVANNQLSNEIREKEKLIDDLDAFSHTVAHDLKNMLGAIVSASNLIRSEIDNMPKEDILEINDLINQSATKTMHVTRELLTLASVRQQEIKMEPVNMQKVVSESINRMQDMIQAKSANLSVPESWPLVVGYESWLEEVWTNFISNAIKYGGTPPEIELSFDVIPENRIKFWIKDNGKGLADNEKILLFNKFTRLDTVRAEGHGLGLSIVKRIIEKLGGEVGVESNNIPGEGSVFYFILKLAKS